MDDDDDSNDNDNNDDKDVDLNPGDAHHEKAGEGSPSEGKQEGHEDRQHLPEHDHDDDHGDEVNHAQEYDVYDDDEDDCFACRLAWDHSIPPRPKTPGTS